MRGGETAYPISIKFCRVVDITDVITYANFGEDRLRSLGVVGLMPWIILYHGRTEGQIQLQPVFFHCY